METQSEQNQSSIVLVSGGSSVGGGASAALNRQRGAFAIQARTADVCVSSSCPWEAMSKQIFTHVPYMGQRQRMFGMGVSLPGR
jgi:hypothetical protein